VSSMNCRFDVLNPVDSAKKDGRSPWICRPGVLKSLYFACRFREYFRTRRADVRQARELRSAFYVQLWRDAAEQLGASVEVLGNEFLEIRLGNARVRVQQNITSLDDAVTVFVAGNKALVHRLLARESLRTPTYCEFTLDKIDQAVAFLKRAGCDCVVKPANGGGGEGVTTGVASTYDLVRAAVLASLHGSTLLIEKQERGEVYRLLYLDGKLLDAVMRKAPTVTGDGKSSIQELIRLENERRLNRGAKVAHSVVQADMDMLRTLAKQQLELSSVPPQGTVVTLKTVINDNSQDDNVSASQLLCQSVIDDGAAAAAAAWVRLAGIDIITTDPGVPLAQSGGVILEVNTTPSYHHHYYKRDGSYAVATHLLPYLFALQQERTSRNSVA
jgi:D-alanine-D-alanine ligase-like ATP-grasp enzyme